MSLQPSVLFLQPLVVQQGIFRNPGACSWVLCLAGCSTLQPGLYNPPGVQWQDWRCLREERGGCDSYSTTSPCLITHCTQEDAHQRSITSHKGNIITSIVLHNYTFRRFLNELRWTMELNELSRHPLGDDSTPFTTFQAPLPTIPDRYPPTGRNYRGLHNEDCFKQELCLILSQLEYLQCLFSLHVSCCLLNCCLQSLWLRSAAPVSLSSVHRIRLVFP